MKTARLFLAFFLFASPLTAEKAIWAKPQRKVVRRTVLDYFRLLPVETGIFESKNREALIGKDVPHVIDLRNDYIRVTGDGAQPSFQIAVFRYRGRDLVAFSSVIGGPDYFFDLWRYENGKWKKSLRLCRRLFQRKLQICTLSCRAAAQPSKFFDATALLPPNCFGKMVALAPKISTHKATAPTGHHK